MRKYHVWNSNEQLPNQQFLLLVTTWQEKLMSWIEMNNYLTNSFFFLWTHDEKSSCLLLKWTTTKPTVSSSFDNPRRKSHVLNSNEQLINHQFLLLVTTWGEKLTPWTQINNYLTISFFLWLLTWGEKLMFWIQIGT